MPCCVGVFRPERRPERIDAGERRCVRLYFKLTRNGEVRFFFKEILLVIRAVGCRIRFFAECFAYRFLNIKCGNAEHFTGAFAVGGGDQRRMHVLKTSFLKKGMHGKSHLVPHPGNRPEGIGTGAEVRYFA